MVEPHNLPPKPNEPHTPACMPVLTALAKFIKGLKLLRRPMWGCVWCIY